MDTDDLARLNSADTADMTIALWRIPCGKAGILDFFLEIIITENVDFDLSSQALRLIGNACADTGLFDRYLLHHLLC